jgi:hypothetical protein
MRTIGHQGTAMRQSMTIRLDPTILSLAKSHANNDNRTLTNYIETLIRKDIGSDEQSLPSPFDDIPVSVFVAEAIPKRLITNPRNGDTPDNVEQRQSYLDIITGGA